MKTNQDRVFLCLAALAALMLLLVIVGESIPMWIRSSLYIVCTMGIIGIMMMRNILGGSRAAMVRVLYFAGLLIMSGIFLSVVLLDQRFETGDPLVWGMEPATAMLVVGGAVFPFWFIVLWVSSFRKAFVTHEKERHLNQLKAGSQPSQEDADG